MQLILILVLNVGEIESMPPVIVLPEHMMMVLVKIANLVDTTAELVMDLVLV